MLKSWDVSRRTQPDFSKILYVIFFFFFFWYTYRQARKQVRFQNVIEKLAPNRGLNAKASTHISHCTDKASTMLWGDDRCLVIGSILPFLGSILPTQLAVSSSRD